MKKIYTSIVATAMAFAATAAPGVDVNPRNVKPSDMSYLRLDESVETPATRAGEIPGPWEPEGERVVYVRSSHAIAPIFTYLIETETTSGWADGYFAEDGSVYVSRAINNILGTYYIKGTLGEDGIVTFEFPQHMGTLSNGMPLDFYLFTVDGYEDGFVTGCSLNESQTYRMYLSEDRSLQPVEEDEYVVIGWAVDGEFGGYGDYGYLFEPQTDEAVTPPEGLETVTAAWQVGDNGNYIKIGYGEGDDVWVQGIFNTIPEGWIKGKVTPGGMKFDSMQLMGIYDPGSVQPMWYYAYCVNVIPDADPENPDICYVDILPEFELVKDSDGVYEAASCLTSGVKLEVGARLTSLIFFYNNYPASLIFSDKLGKPAVPRAPESAEYQIFDMGPDAPALTYIRYNIPQTDVDGTLMNPDCLFYEVMVDGEPYTFMPDQFAGVPEAGLSLVPYRYNLPGGEIVSAWSERSSIHELLYKVPVESIGVRSVYIVDGVRNESDIMTVDISGVEETEIDRQVVDVRYYDLSGVEVSADARGILLRKVSYADGSTRVFKTVRR